MSSQFGAAQHSDGSGSGDGGTMSAPSVNYAQAPQAQHSQLGGPSTYHFQYRMDSPPSMQQTRPPQPATPQQNVQQSSRYVQLAGSPFVPQPQQQQQQQHKLPPPRTPRPVAIPLQLPTRTPSQQQQQQQQQQRHIESPVNSQGGHPMSASTSQHVQSLQSSAGVPASGGQMQQLRQPALEHQYSQGSQSAAPPQSPSVPRSESNAGTTAQHAEADRILHLYMHEYCLKRNYVKSANAIALETGVRTDEGVPLGVESELGLLSKWFRAFWDDYVRSVAHSELQQHARVQPAPQCSPPFSQQHSPFSVAAAGQSARHAASMGADVFGHPYGTVFETPISARSNVMRRIGTEPTVRRVSGGERMASMLGSGSMTPSPFGTGASAAARFWGGGGHADDTTMQHMTPRTLSRETASSMQRLGWEGRPMESLSQEEKTRLGQVVRQAQVAQQAASMHMTQRTQSAGSGSAVSQSTMGGVGLSISSSADSSTGMSAPAEDASLMQNDVVFVGSSNSNRKSPNQAGLQRKKRRSSVNMQALSQIQGSLQSEQRSGGMDNVTNLPPAMSPTTAARNFEEQQLLAKQLQSQSQSILRATASGGVAYGTKQQSTTPTSSLAKRRANASAKSQQAQTEAQKQATSQISAQIQQLEQQKQSQQARSKGTSSGEDSQPKGSHISQLRKLQDKASQNARGMNESHEQQQQQQQQQADNGRPAMHRATSSQGPILTPLIVSSPSAGMAMGPPLSAPATPNSLMQQQQVQQQQHNQHQQQLQQQNAYQPSASPMMPGLFNGLQNRSAGYEQNASSPFLQPAFAVQERQQAPMASPYAAMHHSLGPPTQSLPSHQQQQLFVAQQHGGPDNHTSLCSPAFNFQGAEGPGGEYGGGNVSVVHYGQQVNGLGLGLPGGDGGPSHSTQLGSPMVLQDAALSGHAQQQTTHGMPTFDGGGDNAHQQHSMVALPQDAQHPNAFHASPLHPPHAMAGFNGHLLAYTPEPNNGHAESTSNFGQFASGGGGGEDGRMDQYYMPVP